MINMIEDKIIELINEYTYETTEENMKDLIEDDTVDVIFDVSIEGFAMYFDSIPEEVLEDYFKERFNYYGLDTIYNTVEGWYLVTAL